MPFVQAKPRVLYAHVRVVGYALRLIVGAMITIKMVVGAMAATGDVIATLAY